MCSSYRSNQNPQTVKLSPRSSVHHLATASLPGRYANSFDADAPKPPTYPFINHTFQRARTQNKQHTRTSGVSAVVYPVILSTPFSRSRSVPFRLRFRVCFVSVRRCLGRTRKNPQEEKSRFVTIFLSRPMFTGFFHGGRRLPRLCTGGSAISANPLCAGFQANPAASMGDSPPQIVSAIPVWPKSPAAIASISPSSSTRSAASPGTSRPVSPSICAAQAPPAV